MGHTHSIKGILMKSNGKSFELAHQQCGLISFRTHREYDNNNNINNILCDCPNPLF